MATVRGSLGRSAANRVESAAAVVSGHSGAMATTLRGNSLVRSAANRVESAARRASDGIANLKAAAVGAARGAVVGGAVAAAEGVVLNGIGFTTLGPAAGSYAAGWMSSIALANGVGVSTGSTYAVLQSAAMGGGAILGGPFVIACSVTGAACYYYKRRDRGGRAPTEEGEGGDPPAPDDSTEESEELSSEDDATEGDQQSIDERQLAFQDLQVARTSTPIQLT